MKLIIKHDRHQELIDQALEFATKAHEGQLRDYTGAPYITHPVAVAKIVMSITDDAEMICAALLHDTVEDTDVTHADILEHFGLGVHELVIQLTDTTVHEDGNRATRRKMDRERMSKSTVRGKTIKIADIIHNLTDGIDLAKPGYAKMFYGEKRAMLEEALTEGNERLFAKAIKIIERFEESGNCSKPKG